MLYIPGHGACVDIREDDVPPAWTMETWLYRPSAVIAAKTHIRNAVFLLADYNLAYYGEVVVKAQVLFLTRFLKKEPEAVPAQAEDERVTKEVSLTEANLPSPFVLYF